MMNKIAEIRKSKLYQKNAMLQARKDYDLLELRLLMLGISRVRPHLANSKTFDEDFRTFVLSTSDVIKLFTADDTQRNDLYKRVQSACCKMAQSVICIGDPKNFAAYPVFELIQFSTTGGLMMRFNPQMRRFLLELEDGDYTMSRFEDSLRLSSVYSINLYHWLLSFRHLGKTRKDGKYWRDATVEEIRFILNVPPNAYKGRINNLRRYVLDAPIAEIKAKLGYDITYSTQKQGRIVTGFHFVVVPPQNERDKQNKTKPKQDNLSELEKNLLIDLTAAGMDKPEAIRLLQRYGYERCRNNLDYAMVQRHFASKLPGLIHKAITDDYQAQYEQQAALLDS